MSRPLTPDPLVPEPPAADLPEPAVRPAPPPDHPAAAGEPLVPELLDPSRPGPRHLSAAALAATHDALAPNTLKGYRSGIKQIKRPRGLAIHGLAGSPVYWSGCPEQDNPWRPVSSCALWSPRWWM